MQIYNFAQAAHYTYILSKAFMNILLLYSMQTTNTLFIVYVCTNGKCVMKEHLQCYVNISGTLIFTKCAYNMPNYVLILVFI